MRAADKGGAEVHLHRQAALGCKGAEAVDDEVAERLLLGGRGTSLPEGAAGELLVGLVEAQVAVVSECVFERDLAAVGERVDEQLEEGEVVVEGVDLRTERGGDRVRGVAVVVVGIGVPADREAN